MSKEMINRFLLQDKWEEESEYVITLFEYCDVGCSFCYLDIRDKVGLNTIRDKVKPTLELLAEETKKKIVLNTITGEPFSVSIFNEQLKSDYLFYIQSIHNYCQDKGIEYKINFITNLMQEDMNPMLSFLAEARGFGYCVVISTSYDPKGRFNKRTKTIWLNNIKILKDLGEDFGISVCMTKANINTLLNQKDPTFDKLYQEGYSIFIDYYVPDPGPSNRDKAEPILYANVPSDLDMLKFIIYLIDYYPNLSPALDFINSYRNKKGKLSCRSSKIIDKYGNKVKCGGLHSTSPVIHFYRSEIKKNDNSPVEDDFIKKRDCLSCVHFQYCKMGCFMLHNFGKRTQLKECLYAYVYRYLETKETIDYTTLETTFG